MLLRFLAFCLLASSVTQCWPTGLYEGDSCEGRCGDAPDDSKTCQCNSVCETYRDCCDDYQDVCVGSCKGKCDSGYHPSDPCQCNSKCHQYNNCCPDYDDQCGGDSSTTTTTTTRKPGPGLSDVDLLTLSEMLVELDEDNVADKVQLDLGCKTHSGNQEDCSPNPLFSSVSEEVLLMNIYQKLTSLYDNYISDVTQVEDDTPEEEGEEEDLLHYMMQTTLMKTLYQFLNEKGAFGGSIEDFENYLLEIWFGLYDRGHHGKGSSGFEHVFIGEIKNGDVSGFHNWFHWYYLEKRGHINYLGYWEYVTFQDLGSGISFTYSWDGDDTYKKIYYKPYGSMFISTSPTLEMALYTTCFLTRPDEKCHMTLKGQTVVIQTWTNEHDPYVGSSYPDWK